MAKDSILTKEEDLAQCQEGDGYLEGPLPRALEWRERPDVDVEGGKGSFIQITFTSSAMWLMEGSSVGRPQAL